MNSANRLALPSTGWWTRSEARKRSFWWNLRIRIKFRNCQPGSKRLTSGSNDLWNVRTLSRDVKMEILGFEKGEREIVCLCLCTHERVCVSERVCLCVCDWERERMGEWGIWRLWSQQSCVEWTIGKPFIHWPIHLKTLKCTVDKIQEKCACFAFKYCEDGIWEGQKICLDWSRKLCDSTSVRILMVTCSYFLEPLDV